MQLVQSAEADTISYLKYPSTDSLIVCNTFINDIFTASVYKSELEKSIKSNIQNFIIDRALSKSVFVIE